MNLLYDTNVVLNIIRSNNPLILAFLNPENSNVYVSVATEAEVKSLAVRNKWGKMRLAKLEYFLERATVIDINQNYINNYIEIDTYSQRINSAFNDYPFKTPRNMGKNDLWIASLASLLNLRLVTADADFDHLNGVFIEVRKITSNDLKPFFMSNR